MTQKFFDEQSGAILHMDRYYGFCDAGGLAGSFDGHVSAELASAVISHEYEGCTVSTDPKELGSEAIVVMTGQQFVNELSTRGSLSDWGHFVD